MEPHVRPGGFFFLHIPSVSGYQWHPFTTISCPQAPLLSSSSSFSDPTSGDLEAKSADTTTNSDISHASTAATNSHKSSSSHISSLDDLNHSNAHSNSSSHTVRFMIKTMDPGSWTDDLASLASTTPERISVRLRGPYGGRPFHTFSTASLIIFCAGGIGITPMVSYILGLGERERKTGVAGPKKVLVWSVKEVPELGWLKNILDLSQIKDLYLRLHVTGDSGKSAMPIGDNQTFPIPYEFGRPNFGQIFVDEFDDLKNTRLVRTGSSGGLASARMDVQNNNQSLLRVPFLNQYVTADDKSSVLTMCCGPRSLTTDVKTCAMQLGFRFISESFQL